MDLFSNPDIRLLIFNTFMLNDGTDILPRKELEVAKG